MLKIEKMNLETRDLLNSFKSELRLFGRLEVAYSKDSFSYTVSRDQDPDPSLTKTYDEQSIAVDKYLDNDFKVVYFAFIEGQVVGQIILSTQWNGYGFIEDVRVKEGHKGFGIGRALIAQAKQWCQGGKLSGLMLETQNNNVDACLFYEKMGFQIGGLDRLMYGHFHKVSNEVALFWYWLFLS